MIQTMSFGSKCLQPAQFHVVWFKREMTEWLKEGSMNPIVSPIAMVATYRFRLDYFTSQYDLNNQRKSTHLILNKTFDKSEALAKFSDAIWRH